MVRALHQTIDRKEVKNFFDTIFPSLDGFIEIRHDLKGNETINRGDSFKTINQAVDYVLSLGDRHNIYFGPVARKSRIQYGKGGNDNSALDSWVVWTDLDWHDGTEEQKEQLKVQLKKKLEEFPLPSTATVHTGRGVQVYWVLIDPISPRELRDINSRISTWFAGEADSSVVNPSRIMRVPLTINQKCSKRAKVLELNENKYTLSDLCSALPEPETSVKRDSPSVKRDSPSDSKYLVISEDGGRNDFLTSIKGSLSGRGLKEGLIDEIAHVINEHEETPFEVSLPRGEVNKITTYGPGGWDNYEEWAKKFTRGSQGPEGPLYMSWDLYQGPSNNWLEATNLLELSDPGPTKWVVQGLFPSNTTVVVPFIVSLVLQRDGLLLSSGRRLWTIWLCSAPGTPIATSNYNCSTKLPFGYYGPSGSIKTYLAIHLALCLLDPDTEDYFGFKIPTLKSILFIDYELDKETILRRVHKALRGRGMDPSSLGGFLYYNGKKAPSRDKSLLGALQICKENSVEMAIIDSFGFAMGGDQESQSAVMEFQRKLEVFNNEGIELFMTDHPPRPIKGEKIKDKDVFGSVYKRAWMRGLVQIRRTEESKGKDYADIVVDAKKVSEGQEQPEFTIRAVFDNEYNTVTFGRLSKDEIPEEPSNARTITFQAYQDLNEATVNQVFDHVNRDSLEHPSLKIVSGKLWVE